MNSTQRRMRLCVLKIIPTFFKSYLIKRKRPCGRLFLFFLPKVEIGFLGEGSSSTHSRVNGNNGRIRNRLCTL